MLLSLLVNATFDNLQTLFLVAGFPRSDRRVSPAHSGTSTSRPQVLPLLLLLLLLAEGRALRHQLDSPVSAGRSLVFALMLCRFRRP
jgi:hypothetical protein